MSQVSFTPSAGTVTFVTSSGGGATGGNTFAMPAVDVENTDTTIAFTGSGVLYLSFAAGVPVGPSVVGNLIVRSGETLLLTNNLAVLAATHNPAVRTTQATQAAAATAVSAAAMFAGASVTITRGAAVATETF
jgi:hypothetical protein